MQDLQCSMPVIVYWLHSPHTSKEFLNLLWVSSCKWPTWGMLTSDYVICFVSWNLCKTAVLLNNLGVQIFGKTICKLGASVPSQHADQRHMFYDQLLFPTSLKELAFPHRARHHLCTWVLSLSCTLHRRWNATSYQSNPNLCQISDPKFQQGQSWRKGWKKGQWWEGTSRELKLSQAV